MNFPLRPQAAAVALALAIASSSTFAHTIAAADTVVVTATRTAQRSADIVADTTVIEAAEIARSGATSIADILQRQRGIEIARNGAAGSSTSVFLRGANSNQLVVLLDGVRLGSPTTGTASWNAIPVSAIERIEIVYGPLSTLYGADAVGGVIQIFTHKADRALRANASVGTGSNGLRQLEAGISGTSSGQQAISYTFNAGHEESDGYSATRPGAYGFHPDRDGYRRSNAAGRVTMALAAGHEVGAQFLASRLYNQYDSGSGDYNVHADQDLNSVAVFMTNQLASNWKSTVQLARSEDNQRNVTSADASGISDINTRQDELSWNHAIALGNDTLQVLTSHRKEEVETMGRSRNTNSVALAYSLKRERHLLDVAARRDHSVYGSNSTGSLGYGYDFGHGLRAVASAGTSFRAPTFNELYYPGYGLETNVPERGDNRELGLRYAGNGYQLDASWFRNKLTDMIASAPCPGGGPFSCAVNVNHAMLEGVSVSGSTRIAGVNLRASVDWQDPRDETTGKDLARRAKRHASLGADYKIGAVKAGADWTLTGARFDDAANRNRLHGYGLLDLHASWSINPDWSLLLRVNNVTDKRYEFARNYGSSGRNWFASVRYGFR